ncbi:hypothetical protein AWW66_19725 [Micromonospora rosaria]|uniref:Uncharacterized protein n=1 Tax=Micromonospora rosaria TaxID=47874 RepID=A0A136PP97_9ACTN|nr:hypothetical protein [Micromonospora rosaria]KXK60283.1 hypothetical protein AWW66_19725 [Micromonospora rosaria]
MRVPSRSSGPRSGPAAPSASITSPAVAGPPRAGPSPGGPAVPDLAAYRAAVAELLVEIGALADPGSATARQALVDDRLRDPVVAAVLDATPAGLVAARETLLLELARYQPSGRSAVRDLTGLVRCYLLSRIDLMWWRDVPAFATDAQVRDSPDLVDLEWLRRRDLARFRYREEPTSRVGRALRAADRRLRPYAAPDTAGVRSRRTRREVVALLNDVAREFASAAPAGTPPLWVTSLVRSAEEQYRRRRLGHPVPLPGAHCLGWAVDVELDWYGRFGAREVLAGILRDRQEAGEVNVVDAGSVWHVCPAPSTRARLRRAYEVELGA